jgi:hypothetical protein
MPTRKVVEYLEPGGSSPFAKWFARLDAVAAAKVATVLYRMEQGNLSNVKPVGRAWPNTASISGRGIAFISGRMAMC